MRSFLFRALLATTLAGTTTAATGPPAPRLAVVAYYAGDATAFRRYPTDKLTHLIYSFLHLQGEQFAFDNAQSRATVAALVGLKARHPQLKVLLSLGGWTGCATCSEVFATAQGRANFAASVKQVLQATHTDGIDLDWEYPAIAGPPGHRFTPADRHNFTLLVQALRATLGRRYEISFAAGGFPAYLRHSVEWPAVMAAVDRVNLMSYDLVNGYSTRTGHHTPLYSTPQQRESVDDGVRFLLDSAGVAPEKVVIGAAFYARVFKGVAPAGNGLYQAGSFSRAIDYRSFADSLSAAQGFAPHWDSVAQAPYAYNPRRREFATFDDARSMQLKARYARARRLGGVMFWELTGDKPRQGLLDTLYRAAQ